MKDKPKDLLIELFGNKPFIRILNFVVGKMAFYDYSIPDIAKATDTTKPTAYQAMKHLKKIGLVEKSRTTGKTTLYIANKQSPVFQGMLNMILDTRIPEKKKAKA